MNLRFVGPAGTGKTTVAKILGRLFCAKGILSNPEPMLRKAGDYSSGGHVDVMKNVMGPDLEKANNGIILIDEFYNFNKGHSSGNLASEALEVIMGAADDHKDTLCIIVAGYEDDVNDTFAFNSGCRSRFPNEIKFRNYTTEELVEIFKRKAIKDGYNEPTADVLLAIKPIITFEMNNQGKEFGNARFITDDLFPKIERKYYARKADDNIITINDVLSAFPNYKAVTSKGNDSKSKKPIYEKLAIEKFSGLEMPGEFSKFKSIKSEIKRRQLIAPAVIYIKTDKGSGSGFLISPDGYAITCDHVIKDAKEITARLRIPGRIGKTDTHHKCKVINTKADYDIALIKLEGENFPYLPMAKPSRKISNGEEFTLTGYPLDLDESIQSYNGSISCDNEMHKSDKYHIGYYSIEGEAKKGNSGSPLVSKSDGKVIGLLIGSIIDDHDEINKMRPIKYFWQEFLK